MIHASLGRERIAAVLAPPNLETRIPRAEQCIFNCHFHHPMDPCVICLTRDSNADTTFDTEKIRVIGDR